MPRNLLITLENCEATHKSGWFKRDFESVIVIVNYKNDFLDVLSIFLFSLAMKVQSNSILKLLLSINLS